MSRDETEVLSRIESQIKAVDEEDSLDLILDGVKFKEFTLKIKEKLESLGSRVFSLSANDCALKNLNNFPALPDLAQVTPIFIFF